MSYNRDNFKFRYPELIKGISMNMKLTLPIFFFLFIFLISSYPVMAYYDVDSIGDSYISSAYENTNYGSATTMLTKNLTSGAGTGNYTSFVSFNLSSIPAGQVITSATLSLRLQSFYAYQNETAIDVNVSNTTSFDEYTITYNNAPAINVTQDTEAVLGTYEWKNFTVTDAVNSSYNNADNVYLRIDLSDWIVAQNTQFSWMTKEFGSGYTPYLRVETASGGGCNVSDDYEIGSVCLDQDTFYTNDGCNYTLTDCPAGAYCVQLTPQVNVTSDLYENYTSCQIVTNTGWHVNCWSICFGDYVVWSNCVEEQCKVCGDPEENGLVCIGNDCGYFTDTYYTNQTSVTVPSWTVACGYSNGTRLYYNETGEETTITDILTRAGNSVTNITTIAGECVNTSSTCYDSNCQVVACYTGSDDVVGLKNWINDSFNSSAGSLILAMIISCGIALYVFFKTGAEKMESFIVPFILVLGFFALPGIEFFPSWFLLLEVFIVAVFVFFKVKG